MTNHRPYGQVWREFIEELKRLLRKWWKGKEKEDG
jgi:hypothetical protein